MRKINIAVLVISIFLTVVLGAFVFGYDYDIKTKSQTIEGDQVIEITETKDLGDFLLDYIVFIKDHKWVGKLVAQTLLVAFAFLSGYSISGKRTGKRNAIKKRKNTKKRKSIEIKAPTQTASSVGSQDRHVRF